MKAIILAAGRGSRMGDLTSDAPKCLTLLCGKPLIKWQLEAIEEAGIRETGIVKGYKADKLVFSETHSFENPRWAETNMVSSLLHAAEWLKASECIVSYSDIVYPGETVKKLAAATGDIVITFDPNWLELWTKRFANPLSDAETFRIQSDGVLTEIGNRTDRIDDIKGQYMGLLKFTPNGWSQATQLIETITPEACDRMDMTTMLSRLIARGVRIDTIPVAAPWFEVDSEQDLALVEAGARARGGLLW